jgi:hypothetical protein
MSYTTSDDLTRNPAFGDEDHAEGVVARAEPRSRQGWPPKAEAERA